MGQKINQTSWRKLPRAGGSAVEPLHNFLAFRNRLFEELELKRCISLSLNVGSLTYHSIEIIHSFESNIVIKLKLSLSLPENISLKVKGKAYFFHCKRGRRTRKRNLKTNLIRSYSLRHPSSRTAVFEQSTAKIVGVLRHVKGTIMRRAVILIYNPTLSLLYNKNFLASLSSIFQATFRYRKQDNYRSILFLTMAIFFLKNWPKPLASFIARTFSRTRKHGVLLRFYKSIIENGFDVSRSLSSVRGIQLRFQGRFDKRPRSGSYSISMGVISNQTLSGILELGRSVAVTKNGTFGIQLITRY